ncbi:MAG: LysE family translocator [Hyphomicrobiales bacterium]|nr:MAG: LysE family translocator [Hyphomicrobiales bacterium]
MQAATSFLSSFDAGLFVAYVVLMMSFNLTPGPAVMKVVSDAVRYGVRPAHFSMAGIFAANMMYALLAVAGMGALIAAFPILFEAIKWIGVAYLTWLAVKAAARAWAPAERAVAAPPQRAGSLFLTSFAVQGANPKSVLTFCVTLPIFAGPGDGIEWRMMALALLNNFLEYPVLLTYSLAGAGAARMAAAGRFRRFADLAGATALGAAAAMVARTSLPSR